MKPHYRLRFVINVCGARVYWLERDGRRVSLASSDTTLLARSIGGEL